MTKKAFQIAVFLVAFGFGSAVVYFIAPSLISAATYPTDSELEIRFVEKRAKFNSLLKLFKEDSHVSRVNSGGVWADFDKPAEVPAERLEAYMELFGELEIRSIHRYPVRGSVELRVWSSKRLLIGGKTKSYVFDPGYTGKLTYSLDEVYRSGVDANHYKSLGDNWYVYLDVW